MKTFLMLLSLVSAIAVPSALAAETAGVSLPTALDPTHLFAAFAVTVFTMTVLGDYARSPSRLAARVEARINPPHQAAHPLAA